MKKFAFAAVAALSFVSSAFAQQPSDKVTFTVTRAELQVIGQGVMELPYKISAPVMQSLQQQLAAHDQTAAKATADAKAPPVVPEQPKPAQEPAK